MAPQKPVARKSGSKRETQQADQDTAQNGRDEEVTKYEKELAGYLQNRIKPGLNSGAIPLLARSIAKDIAHQDQPNGASADDTSDAEEEVPDFEQEMQELQAELGQDWILRFSVHGDDAWLTAEKDDGSQRLEAQTAAVLLEAVELIKQGGGRSG